VSICLFLDWPLSPLHLFIQTAAMRDVSAIVYGLDPLCGAGFAGWIGAALVLVECFI
jgi:hypothetical protein